jgi:hypothetical protein
LASDVEKIYQVFEFAKLSFKKKVNENEDAQPKPVYIGVDDKKPKVRN